MPDLCPKVDTASRLRLGQSVVVLIVPVYRLSRSANMIGLLIWWRSTLVTASGEVASST